MINSINWDAFERNCGSEGLQKRFEDLCRQLFYEQCGCDDVYPLYQENNPGLETEPVSFEGKRVGFQAKYFTSDKSNKFKQLEKSAEKIIEYYNGKVDSIVLYTNKPLSDKVQDDLIGLLEPHGFDIQFCWGEIILDYVRKGKSYIKEYYFGELSFDRDWFSSKYSIVSNEIKPEAFIADNIITKVERQLSVFTCSSRGADIFNKKKRDLLALLQDLLLGFGYNKYSGYILSLISALGKITDVDEKSMMKALSWCEIVSDSIVDESTKLKNRLAELNNYLEQDNVDYNSTLHEIHKVEKLLAFSGFAAEEGYLPFLKKKVLLLSGKGGYGKTHSLLHEYCSLYAENRDCIFLRGSQFCDSFLFDKQILEILDVPYSLEEFIDCLELRAVDNEKRVVTLIIDALNEASETKQVRQVLSRLMTIISDKEYVRLIVSCRDEYVDALIPDVLCGLYEKVDVAGFSESGEEFTAMLQQYGILFSPEILFNDNIDNPLFCKLYLKNYYSHGENVFSLEELFNEIIKDANERSYHQLQGAIKNVGGRRDLNWAMKLVEGLARLQLKMKRRGILLSEIKEGLKSEIYNLPLDILLDVLVERGVLYRIEMQNNDYRYFFVHQRFRDYYLARIIVDSSNSAEEVKQFIEDYILPCGNVFSDFNNVDLFSQVAYQFSLKYHKECWELLMSKEELWAFRRDYIQSFAWRKDNNVSAEELLTIASAFRLDRSVDFWQVFLSDSLNDKGNFNAEALHRLLSSLSLTKRDYCWTIPISSTGYSERVISVMKSIADGSLLISLTLRKKLLFLILCSWLLTSTNRELRDTTSKAMIVVLNDDISSCEKLLCKFKSVDDPYILERLYEITLGVVTRSDIIEESAYSSLVRYIHSFVFAGDESYPDIVILDVSSLIIKHYMSIFPGSPLNGELVMKSAYNPKLIQNTSPGEYEIMHEFCGSNAILGSMQFAFPNHMYGDFGRYVFQSSLPKLSESDQKAVHDYALGLIFNKYNYNNEYFDDFDKQTSHNSYRYDHIVERIGKKYEWLAYFETLSRVLNHDNSRDVLSIRYRTFDPTANYLLSKRNENRKALDFYKSLSTGMFMREDRGDVMTGNWVENPRELRTIIDNLIIKIDDNEWVNLSTFPYFSISLHDEKEPFAVATCTIKVVGFFLPTKQACRLKTFKEKGLRFFPYDMVEIPRYPYSSYVRSYPWDKGDLIDIENNNNYLSVRLPGGSDYSFKDSFSSSCRIAPEFEYDYSEKFVRNETEHLVPCPQLIEVLGLKAHSNSDFDWYNGDEKVCFCYQFESTNGGLLIRKDYLKRFLKTSKRKLVWFVFCDKTKQSYFRQYYGSIGYSDVKNDEYIFMDDTANR